MSINLAITYFMDTESVYKVLKQIHNKFIFPLTLITPEFCKISVNVIPDFTNSIKRISNVVYIYMVNKT